MNERSIATLIAALLMSLLVASCSKTIGESSAAYKAACQGSPMRTVEVRNKAMEDGYDINRQYDCIDKASFVAVNEQRAKWQAANTPEATAKRGTASAEKQAHRSDQSENSRSQNRTIGFFSDLQYGMSPADVLSLLPGSKPATTDSHTVDGSQL